MVHSHYGPVVMVHLVVVMVHLGKSLWSTSKVVMGHLRMFGCANKRYFEIPFSYYEITPFCVGVFHTSASGLTLRLQVA